MNFGSEINDTYKEKICEEFQVGKKSANQLRSVSQRQIYVFPRCVQGFLNRYTCTVLLKVVHARWASTLANRSNARHRSYIRAPPRLLPPDVCIQSVGICVARVAGSDSELAGVSGCHIFVPAPHAPPPKGIGQRSKVVILPTTAGGARVVFA